MITLNDRPVLVLSLSLPKVGCWLLDVEVDADENITGAVTLKDAAGNAFEGTVHRSGLLVGRVHARIMGGKGGLSKTVLEPQHYRSLPARIVAEAIISDAGETIDPTSDPLRTNLDFWSRQRGTGGRALSLLCDEIGSLWRVLPNGNVWLGADSSEPLVLPEVLELDRNQATGTIELGLDALLVLPGEVLGTERVSRILYRQTDKQPLRATVWPEAA